MTAPRLTVITGGGNVPREFVMQDDPIPFAEAMKGLDENRAPNVRIRKRLMIDQLQKAGIAIHRGDFERADYILADVRTAIANTRKRKT